MARASENNLAAPQTWIGRSGRSYRLASGMDVSRGSKATVRMVTADGPPMHGSPVAEGARLALKLPWKGNPDAPDAIDSEAVWLELFTRHATRPPCPQLVDTLTGQQNATGRERVTGLFMEWCPENLES